MCKIILRQLTNTILKLFAEWQRLPVASSTWNKCQKLIQHKDLLASSMSYRMRKMIMQQLTLINSKVICEITKILCSGFNLKWAQKSYATFMKIYL